MISMIYMIIFKNLSKAPKGNFPQGMIVEGTKGGTMKRTLMKDSYAKELWKRRPGSFFGQVRSLLIKDSAKSHLGDVSIHLENLN